MLRRPFLNSISHRRNLPTQELHSLHIDQRNKPEDACIFITILQELILDRLLQLVPRAERGHIHIIAWLSVRLEYRWAL